VFFKDLVPGTELTKFGDITEFFKIRIVSPEFPENGQAYQPSYLKAINYQVLYNSINSDIVDSDI